MRPQPLVTATLLGLAFWVGLFAAIEKYGLGTVVTWGVGIVAIAAFLGLVGDAFAAAKDARRNFDDVDRLAVDHWNRREMERRNAGPRFARNHSRVDGVA